MLAFVDRLQARFDAGIGRPGYVAPAPPPPPAPAPAPRHAAPEPAAAPSAPAGAAAPGPVAPDRAAARHRYPRTYKSPSAPSTGATTPPGLAAAAAAGSSAPQYGSEYPRDEPALDLVTVVLPSMIKRYGIFVVAGVFVTWLVARVARRAKRRKS
jgi:hypothetical protein